MTKNTKVLKQSDSTHTDNHSARTHANVTKKQAVPSTGSLPTLEYLKTNDSIQKAVADRLSDFNT